MKHLFLYIYIYHWCDTLRNNDILPLSLLLNTVEKGSNFYLYLSWFSLNMITYLCVCTHMAINYIAISKLMLWFRPSDDMKHYFMGTEKLQSCRKGVNSFFVSKKLIIVILAKSCLSTMGQRFPNKGSSDAEALGLAGACSCMFPGKSQSLIPTIRYRKVSEGCQKMTKPHQVSLAFRACD